MKSTLLIVSFILIASSATSAQDIKSAKPDSLFANFFKKYSPFKKNTDSKFFGYQNIPYSFKASPDSFGEGKSVDNMPNAYSKQIPLNYSGNNNKGFSIYQSGIDNLYVLKPDSSFYSAMPVKSY